MIRLMLDSDVLADLPAGVAPLLATYSDLVPSRAALELLAGHHPGSVIILIDRGLGDPTGLASVADVEPGALSPGDLPAWFGRKEAAGIRWLTVYCDRADLAACDEALGGRGHWRWVATLDGTAWLDLPGYEPLRRPAVIQCLSAAMTGVHADGSLVLNDGWHPAS